MADVSKAEKLASARKKFKELKKEKKKNAAQKTSEVAESAPTSREQTPVEHLVTPINGAQNVLVPDIALEPTILDHVSAASTSLRNDQIQLPASPELSNDIQDNTIFINQESSEAPNLSNYFSKTAPSFDLVSGNFGAPVNFFDQTASDKFEEQPKLTQEISQNSVPFIESTEPSPQYSSVEGLKQLSAEMAQLISPNSEYSLISQDTELERRNQELASLLSAEKLKTDQLTNIISELQSKVRELDAKINEKELLEINGGTAQAEVGNLREELQCHIQTVGILVGEKAELSANLSQFQLSAKQKTAECEELQGRLKASRSRVADLEREINILKSEKTQVHHLGREQVEEVEKLKQTSKTLLEEREELMQDLLEAREKFRNTSEANSVLQHQIHELSGQLSMANVKIQQLSTGNQVDGQVEELTKTKFALEQQLADLQETVKILTKERDDSNLNYQQYAQQLNGQLGSLAAKLEQLQKENENLSMQEQNRIRHIGELEKQLQNLQNDQVSFAIQRNNGEVKAELESSLDLVQKLRGENCELREEIGKIADEKEIVARDLEAKIDELRQLEHLVEELKGSQPDNVKLLAAMESDKVAASRAVMQNTEMKEQMESMQEVFMKLNNDKVELTEKLATEQRDNKDLMEKLQKTEIHLQTLAEAIEIKDKELYHLQENSAQLNKQVLQSEQLTDRLRHYEAQDHSSHSLQVELQQAKQTIAKLTEEVRKLSINKGSELHIEPPPPEEVTELKQKLSVLESQNRELELKLTNVNNQIDALNGTGPPEINTTDSNHNDEWDVLDKESAMQRLEAKFLRTMDDIATLTEEKQRLEHLVLQLQSETETIGEYVALYQHQRSVLKQKAIEKDQQLTQLANDREQIKSKLEKLNDLVKKLVVEKGTITTELLQHHEILNRDSHELCEEHARIHNEINKITENSLKGNNANCDNQNTETAEEIIALLSEIKTSNLVQPTENFHHCPWCSGQLITV